MVKSWNRRKEKIQKFMHNARSSFEPMDLIGTTDIYVRLTGVLGKEKTYMCLIFQLQKINLIK